MKKLYKFVASSSLSFAVIHCGRMMYVNFSAFFRGKSTYHTTDRELAEKIRAHKWYREGRITEVVSSTKYRYHSNTIFIMEETIKNVISDLQYKVDVLKQEKQYLLDMCRNCETCAQRFCCQYCKNKTAKVIAIRIKRK